MKREEFETLLNSITVGKNDKILGEFDRLHKELEEYAKWKTPDCDMSDYNPKDLFICKVDSKLYGWTYTLAYYVDGNFVSEDIGRIIDNPNYFKLLKKGNS